MDIFAKASRSRLKFTTGIKGVVTLEDVWQLPLSTLRKMANEINRKITKSDDLFAEVKAGEELEKLRLDVLVEVIKIRNEEQKAKVSEAEVEQRRKLLKELIEKRKLEETSSKSVEELEAELAKLEGN